MWFLIVTALILAAALVSDVRRRRKLRRLGEKNERHGVDASARFGVPGWTSAAAKPRAPWDPATRTRTDPSRPYPRGPLETTAFAALARDTPTVNGVSCSQGRKADFAALLPP